MAKTWKQPRCSSVGECIDKLYYTQTREYYWAPEKKKKSYQAMKEPHMHFTKWKEPIWRRYILYNSSSLTSLEKPTLSAFGGKLESVESLIFLMGL